MGKPVIIDLMEIDNGQPHWLSPRGRWPHLAKSVAEKHRKLRKAQRAVDRVNAKLEEAGTPLKDKTK